MAIYNKGFDISMKASDYCKTTTAQYKVVGMCWNSTAADWTCYMANAGSALDDSSAALGAIGVIQNLPSANCTEVTVRTMGISKVICAGSVAAGNFVYADYTASTTTKCGKILGGYSIDATNATSRVVIGRALEDGSSDAVIEIILQPHLIANV